MGRRWDHLLKFSMSQKNKRAIDPFSAVKLPLAAPTSPLAPNIQEAIALHQRGALGPAEEIYRKILAIEPKSADALHLLGVISYQAGSYDASLDLINRAIELNPHEAAFYCNKGNALKELRQLHLALHNYDKSIKIKPDYSEAYSNRGNTLRELKKLDAAIASYDKAIGLNPDYAEAYSNKGNALYEQNKFDAAIAIYDKAISLSPGFAEAHYNRGLALQELRQYSAAVASYERAIDLRSDYAEAFSNRGSALKQLDRPDAAIISYTKAISLRPDYAEAYYNRGLALQELRQLAAAVDDYDKAISLRPDYAQAYSNRGNALKELRRLAAAIVSYERAISLKPDFAEANWNKSLLFLLNGNFEDGWTLYEWRWKVERSNEIKRNFSKPLMLVGDTRLNGFALLHAEQGLGDTIQFCRYVEMVAGLGAKVILEVQKPLLRLLKDLPGVWSLIAKGDPLPEFDFHCPLLSLPLAFKTDLESIPCATSYLKAEPQRVAYWMERLKSDKFKVGIAWQGGQSKIDIGRSFDIRLFRKIASLPNIQLISLQKNFGSEQLKSLPVGMAVTDLGEDLDADGAFLDTAAVMMSLDLVITSDTAIAHLAGALGVKVWVALKFVPDWRWMLERSDSPWYPSMTLYRQQSIGDWKAAFDAIEHDLKQLAKTATSMALRTAHVATTIPTIHEAIALHQQGKLASADTIYRLIIAGEPRNASALHLLGVIAYQTGNSQASLDLINKAIEVSPNEAAFYSSKGLVLRKMGKLRPAVESYDEAISLRPDYAEAFLNRGVALQELKQLDTAAASYDSAIRLQPEFAEAHSNKGNILQELNQFNAAITCYDKAISFKPNFADAHLNKGSALQKLKQFHYAIASYDEAIRLRPAFAEVFYNKGNALRELKQLDAAIASYEMAISLRPGYEYLFGILQHMKMMTCDWRGFESNVSTLINKIQNREKASLSFSTLALPMTPHEQRASAEIWSADKYAYSPVLGPIQKSEPKDKIHIGYYSADFYAHPVSLLIIGLLEHHDKTRFELTAFSIGSNIHDEMQGRIIKAFDRFIDVQAKSDREVAELSRTLGIDVAIDLGGHTQDFRLGIFSFRAAPIQVSYLGYPGTLGADYIDYLIADKILIPKESQAYYSEKIVYLPHSYQSNDKTRVIASTNLSKEELGLPKHAFVFCCFNNSFKITPPVFDAWVRILKEVDGSVLWLLEDNLTAVVNLRKEALRRGLDPGRLVFAKRMDLPEHLARHRAADLFLDTLPYNAHTTASDALWAGLPVLTCMGESFAGRVAASLLHAIGLPEMITETGADYEALAITLAKNPSRLEAIKDRLHSNRMRTPLFDTPLFARHIEAAYTKIYERYQTGLPPDHIFIDPHVPALLLEACRPTPFS